MRQRELLSASTSQMQAASLIIALTLDRRENKEHQYAVDLGLYAHRFFKHALGKGRMKLRIVEKQHREGGDLLDFEVHWSMDTPLWELHFRGRGYVPSNCSGQAAAGLQFYPKDGVLKQPESVEGQEQWPTRVVFELYAMVWYPFCRWRDEEAGRRNRGQSS